MCLKNGSQRYGATSVSKHTQSRDCHEIDVRETILKALDLFWIKELVAMNLAGKSRTANLKGPYHNVSGKTQYSNRVQILVKDLKQYIKFTFMTIA
jgi:hypothetical protein